VIARVLLLAGAVALIAAGVVRADRQHACAGARQDAFAIGLKRAPASGADAVAQRLAGECRGAEQLLFGASAFLAAGADRAAARLARESVAREPQRRDSWIALARVRQRDGDASGAERALARARSLDPLSFDGR
jgi:Tfp pilus assembly protein PilF